MADADFTQIVFNHHDPAIMQDPYAVFAEVRGRCPLGHSDELQGFYFPTTYDGVKRVFSEFRTFASSPGTGLPAQPVALLPVDLDPPQHTRWRRVLNAYFTAEAAAAAQPRVQAIADGLIDAFIARGSADAVNELTFPLLALTMLPVLGVPLADRQMLADKLLWIVHNRLDNFEGYAARHAEIGAYLTNLVATRRAGPPGTDLVQCLIDGVFDGAKLTDTQGYQVLLLTLFGALDSTSATMSSALYHLARNPQDKARLSSGEVPWAVAIEEFLRVCSPIQALRRTVMQPTELDGGRLQPGDTVLALNGAGNYDPAKFPEPERCIIDRDARDHLTFGAGGHVCIGRHFARIMVQTCLATVLRRLPDFRVAEGFVPEYTPSEARALKSLPLVFTAGGVES